VGLFQVALDPASSSLVYLELGEMMEVLTKGPSFALSLLSELLGVACKCCGARQKN
jgi:hypothetical protein